MSEVETHNPYAPPAAPVASVRDHTVLEHRSVWLMLVFVLCTFGLDHPVWFFRRRRGLNLLDSPRKLPMWPLMLFAGYLVTAFVIGLMTGGSTVEEAFGVEAAMALRIAQLIMGVLMIMQCFAVKDIIEDHAQGPDDASRDEMFKPHVKLSGLMTFFFSIFYLQWAINHYVVGGPTR